MRRDNKKRTNFMRKQILIKMKLGSNIKRVPISSFVSKEDHIIIFHISFSPLNLY